MLSGVALIFFAVDADRDRLASAVRITEQDATAAQIAAEKKRDYKKVGRWSDLSTNVLLTFALGGGLAGIAYMREGYRFASVEQERNVAEAQSQKQESDAKLAILQAQVEPHFLFNSLASVRALVKQEPDRAQATIDALVTFLRASIPQMRAEQGVEVVSTVKQQVDLAKAYLDVMAVRMGDRLTVKVDVPEILYEHPFPPLLLISLAENAIKHGAEAKAGTTHITIRAKTTAAQQLMISVTDTGVGLQPVATSGVGLANIRAQLTTRFGDTAELQLSQNNTGEGGVIASIVIPLHHT
jgi:LytS/YehU family sensor histidine kinase